MTSSSRTQSCTGLDGFPFRIELFCRRLLPAANHKPKINKNDDNIRILTAFSLERRLGLNALATCHRRPSHLVYAGDLPCPNGP